MTCTAYSCQVMATRPAQDTAPADATPALADPPRAPADPQRPRLSKAAVVGRAIALADEGVKRHLEGLTVRKVIVIQDRIVNIVAG